MQESTLGKLLLWILLTMIVSTSYFYLVCIYSTFTVNAHLNCIFVSTVHYTELNINFQESDYVVNENDEQGSIILHLREVQNSFTVTLYPVSITEARDPAGFNVSDFVASVPIDAQATPGKRFVPSQKSHLLGDL